MSSLASSLARGSCLFRCAIPASGKASAPSRAKKCNFCPSFSCRSSTLPSPSMSATPHSIIVHSRVETGSEIERVECDSHQTCGALQSLLSLVVALAMTIGIQGAPSSRDTFEDVPQTLSGGDRRQRIQKPKSAKAESCTTKCVSTCVRGGAGSGEGPLNVRRPLVVFKEGFRSRQYCHFRGFGLGASLVECSDICNLIGDGDDGP